MSLADLLARLARPSCEEAKWRAALERTEQIDQHVEAQAPEVDALVAEADAAIERNHLADKIHRALREG